MKKYYSLVTEDGTADLYIYGDITSMETADSDVSSYSIQQELAELDVDNINVYINSYGGEVAEALAIYNTLTRHEATVTTYVDGFACSAATIVFMAGERRVMSEIGNFLVHAAWSVTMGNADDLRKEADNLDAITEQSVKIYVDKTGRTRDEIVELMAQERFMTPEEVLEWGFATEIEAADASVRPAASVERMIHILLCGNMLTLEEAEAEFDLDELADRIADLVAEKIKSEDPEEEPEPEPEPEPDPEEPDDEDNQEASQKGCFFDAFKERR